MDRQRWAKSKSAKRREKPLFEKLWRNELSILEKCVVFVPNEGAKRKTNTFNSNGIVKLFAVIVTVVVVAAVVVVWNDQYCNITTIPFLFRDSCLAPSKFTTSHKHLKRKDKFITSHLIKSSRSILSFIKDTIFYLFNRIRRIRCMAFIFICICLVNATPLPPSPSHTA